MDSCLYKNQSRANEVLVHASRQGFLDLAKLVIDINRGGQKRLNQVKKEAKVD